MSGQICDGGFADRSMIPLLLRRIRLRTAVAQVRGSIEALANLLDQQGQALGGMGAALTGESLGLARGDREGGVGGDGIGRGEGDALREHELLEGVHLVSQLLDRIEIGIRHGLFSPAVAQEGRQAGEAAHRLCGGAK